MERGWHLLPMMEETGKGDKRVTQARGLALLISSTFLLSWRLVLLDMQFIVYRVHHREQGPQVVGGINADTRVFTRLVQGFIIY